MGRKVHIKCTSKYQYNILLVIILAVLINPAATAFVKF